MGCIFLSSLFDWIVLFHVFCFCFIIITVIIFINTIIIIINIIIIIIITIIIIIIIFFVLNPFCKFMYCLNPFIFYFMPQVKDQQSHSLDLIFAYLIFMAAIFRLFLNFIILYFYFRITE